MKPEQTSFWRFYFVNPFIVLGADLAELFYQLYIHVTGHWYCEYCNKYHARRVHVFQISGKNTLVTSGVEVPVCSLGRDALIQGTFHPHVSSLSIAYTIDSETIKQYMLTHRMEGEIK